ncbi:unnamed protein product [Heterobilharzia americana]|nr:unnamed protein product [Heterobilharzia americana]
MSWVYFPNSEEGTCDTAVDLRNISSVQDKPESFSYNLTNQLFNQSLSNMDYNTQRQLQLLLLQKLIELQLAENYNSLKVPFELADESNVHSENFSTLPCIVQSPDSDDYSMPVEAKFEGESSLSLRITPRDDNGHSNQGTPVTVEYPTKPIVLYPFTVQHDVSLEEKFSVNQSVLETCPSGPTPQTLKMTDIHHCIRRGSLEFPPEPGNDIVESIRGHTRPGFVLLSVRHEKINTDNRPSPTSAKATKEIIPSVIATENPEPRTSNVEIPKKSSRSD